MGLTNLIRVPEFKEKLRPLRPKLPRKLNAPLKVEPRSQRYMLVGTAFDYLLRFELQRRAPHAISDRWGAEYAPEIITPEEIAERARVLLENAKAAVAAYLMLKVPTTAKQAELAGHAIRLAKLHSACLALKLEPGFEEASEEDIQDLVDLLGIVPFDELLHDKMLLLNPTFRQSSYLVGAADADLISGDLLVDFKTTKENEIRAGSLDQILGYFLLARKQHLVDPTFPEINRLGLYYCRHGFLWSLETSNWTSNPEFPGIEDWFFQRAAEIFGVTM